MIFNTWAFAVFALTTLALYRTIPGTWRPRFLILAGAIFYAYAVPAYLALIAILGVVTYGIGAAMMHANDARRRKMLLTVGLTAIVGTLVVFKYLHLADATIDRIARHDILPLPNIVVPLAISFFTFEFAHVLVDIYLGKIRTLDPTEFTAFTMFFPTMVAGPIKRYQHFVPQIGNEHINISTDTYAVVRIVCGLAKKAVLADSLSSFTAPLLAPTSGANIFDYWIAVLAYAGKIYFDFSGYSDIAIGVAQLLGYHIPENFSAPYASASVAEFWRRWHMSLSSWIRDYLFIPLGGSRRPPLVVLGNLTFVMTIVGLWHGAAAHFAAWGLWHGIGLSGHRVWSRLTNARPALSLAKGPQRAIAIAATFAFIALGWVLFACPTIAAATTVYRALLGYAG